jgi:protein-disulfide isomerase
MTRTLTIFAALALIALGGWALTTRTAQTPDPFGAAFAQDASQIDTSMIQEMTLGNPDATVTVIEYASFTCPHCAAFHAENFKKLKADYIDTGKIKFVYREIYFDRFGLWAAIVARCGEGAENRFFGIADVLYDKQRDWANPQNSPEEIVTKLKTIGKTAGLDDTQLDACFTDGDNAEALYARFLQTSEADGINSTPSFVINGTKYQNMPYDEMKQILDAALAG